MSEPLDCRSPEGEAVGMIDSAIHTLRAASRADLTHPAVRDALLDLLSDPEIMILLNTTQVKYDREVLVEILVYHYRSDIKGCGCGWAELGKSWPKHVADVYEQWVAARAS